MVSGSTMDCGLNRSMQHVRLISQLESRTPRLFGVVHWVFCHETRSWAQFRIRRRRHEVRYHDGLFQLRV